MATTTAPATRCDDCREVKSTDDIRHMGETLVCTTCQPAETPAVLSVRFEQDACGRCLGTGQYHSLRANGRCFDCHGTRKVFTRAGRAAHKRYSAVMAEMERTWGDVQPGDKVSHNARWVTVASTGDSATVATVVDGQRIPALCAEFANGSQVITSRCDTVRVWDREVFVKACRAVAHLKGAIVENLPAE